MRRIAGTYVLFFLTNSIAYLLVDALKGKINDGDTLSEKIYVGLIVLAILSVVSLIVDRVGTIVVRRIKERPKICFTIVLVLIIAISILVDMCLLSIMTDVIELRANLLDRFLLTGLCQIVPIGILKDERSKKSTPL